jgi:hypothetical protein
MSPSSCDLARLVERHFTSGLPPALELEMRSHLPGCERCRKHYDRRLVLARMDPAAPSAEARMARGLGLRRAPRAWLPAAGLVLVATCAIFLFVRPGSPAFTARGESTETRGEVRLYQLHDERSLPVAASLPRRSELALAYANPAARPYLMVFATDRAGQVYWLAPSWTDPAGDPQALRIASGPRLHELPEAVTHEFAAGALAVHSLFLAEPIGVREIERRLRDGEPLPGEHEVRRLEVSP